MIHTSLIPLEMVQRFISATQAQSERLFLSIDTAVKAYLAHFPSKGEEVSSA